VGGVGGEGERRREGREVGREERQRETNAIRRIPFRQPRLAPK